MYFNLKQCYFLKCIFILLNTLTCPLKLCITTILSISSRFINNLQYSNDPIFLNNKGWVQDTLQIQWQHPIWSNNQLSFSKLWSKINDLLNELIIDRNNMQFSIFNMLYNNMLRFTRISVDSLNSYWQCIIICSNNYVLWNVKATKKT